ncbi:hypothetical protein [Dictyobacter aurantiacus]|uniref:Helix-turn-helix domain-containing protein n=1 Tax=Dictyobacter aurantiacus TaxID=1936993 RepID=A0A401ZQ53_9CHLR|nr:hypothetical protein [Dictyobacter aurantiacus]GCE08886.1 hypothetical protein KDAU_62150 [Dictyobacter aurantiacus]
MTGFSGSDQTETLNDMCVVQEAAQLLGVKTSRIHAMIEDETLPSRLASMEEIAQLLFSKRIKGVPGSGIRLIPQSAVAAAVGRRKRGWPKGVARYQHKT